MSSTKAARLAERKAATQGFLKICIKNLSDVEIYTRTVQRNGKDSYQAKLFKGTAAKPVFFIRFESTQRREQYVTEYINAHIDRSVAKARSKAAITKGAHPFKVGDILQGTYGYDETYYKFYQVVQAGEKTVKVRELNQQNTGKASGDRWEVAPVADSFCGDVELKHPQTYDGKSWCIKDRNHHLGIWDGRPRYASI